MLASFKQIRVKASLFVFLLLTLTTFIFYLMTVRIMNNHIQEEVFKRSESLTRSIASTAGYSFLAQDLLGLDNLVFKIRNSNQDIEYIAIINLEGEIIVHSDVKKAGAKFDQLPGAVFRTSPDGTAIKEFVGSDDHLYEIASPISFMDKKLGTVILGLNESTFLSAQKEAQGKIILVFFLILLLGITSSLLLSSFLTRPIQELSLGVLELKEGKRSRPLRVYSQDELGQLTESFNEMTALITAQRDKLSKYAQELEEAYVSTVRVLGAAIEARDHYTLGHSTRVAQLSVQLGRKHGLSEEALEELEIACLFHDVGKIKIPDSILLKEDKLDLAEVREMKRHPEYGAEILSKASSLLKYIPAIRHHHEWYDGSGYPDGLAGDRIPVQAAIMSLADVYDAMTSERPYRKALSEEDAIGQIAKLAGIQFEPGLVSSFLVLLREKTGLNI